MMAYGDEQRQVCQCGHGSFEHDAPAPSPCRSLKCPCSEFAASYAQLMKRDRWRSDLTRNFPDGFYTVPALLERGHAHPTYCRWCQHKLQVTGRGAVTCPTCDEPASSELDEEIRDVA